MRPFDFRKKSSVSSRNFPSKGQKTDEIFSFLFFKTNEFGPRSQKFQFWHKNFKNFENVINTFKSKAEFGAVSEITKNFGSLGQKLQGVKLYILSFKISHFY